MNNHYFTAMLRLLFCAALLSGAVTGRADEAIKVVYQLSEERLASQTMNNIANHLSADPGVKIVVIVISTGVRAFMFGGQDSGGRPYSEWVDQLGAQGVEFRICQNSMSAMDVARSELIEGLRYVPSGMAEIARLQAREHYVYVRP
jgi:intracellular sulfur oxidation DsrE/DsrF family protein